MEKSDVIEIKTLDELCIFDDVIKRPLSYGKKEGKYNFQTGSRNFKRFTDDYDNDKLIIIMNEKYLDLKDKNKSNKCRLLIDKYCSVSTGTITFRSKTGEIMTKYIYYFLINEIALLIEKYTGDKFKMVSVDDIKSVKIPIPPFEELIEIITDCEYVENKNKKIIDQTNEQRKQLVKKATEQIQLNCKPIKQKFKSLKNKMEPNVESENNELVVII